MLADGAPRFGRANSAGSEGHGRPINGVIPVFGLILTG
jgi:hypothetical protein